MLPDSLFLFFSQFDFYGLCCVIVALLGCVVGILACDCRSTVMVTGYYSSRLMSTEAICYYEGSLLYREIWSALVSMVVVFRWDYGCNLNR